MTAAGPAMPGLGSPRGGGVVDSRGCPTGQRAKAVRGALIRHRASASIMSGGRPEAYRGAKC